MRRNTTPGVHQRWFGLSDVAFVSPDLAASLLRDALEGRNVNEGNLMERTGATVGESKEATVGKRKEATIGERKQATMG